MQRNGMTFLSAHPSPGNSSVAAAGYLVAPNPPDGSLYISPTLVGESNHSIVRGRLRGVYYAAHPVTTFGDGQVIQGANDYAAKTFMVVKGGPAGGYWLIDTTDTVETN
jgi:hypothetical protein